jgi:hypothetical protein
MKVPHACGFATALPPDGEQFAPWDGPAAQMGACCVLKYG